MSLALAFRSIEFGFTVLSRTVFKRSDIPDIMQDIHS